MFRITAYIHLFVQKLRRKSKPEPLHPDTLTQAKFHILRIDQREHFVTEYELLQHDKSLPKNHQLQNLAPFFDTDYNIRVGGRLGQSPYCESKKFPVLVSKNSTLVSLIIRHFHEASLHGGGQLTLNLIRQEYLMTNAKPLVNSFIKKCITCFRVSTTPPVQIMADLPSERVTPSRSFTHCGLDFAGLFFVKYGADDEVKHCIVFVCFSTKAVHLEVVPNLTKEDCIFALNRFIARRGMPANIVSDNGMNFLGAGSDLLRLKVLDKSDKDNSLAGFVIEKNCEWVTISPRAPHFGGIWEAGAKSMKRHLRRIIGTRVLALNEFQSSHKSKLFSTRDHYIHSQTIRTSP